MGEGCRGMSRARKEDTSAPSVRAALADVMADWLRDLDDCPLLRHGDPAIMADEDVEIVATAAREYAPELLREWRNITRACARLRAHVRKCQE